MGRKPSPPDKNPTPHWSISGLILGGLCVCAAEWVIAYSVTGGHPAKLIPTFFIVMFLLLVIVRFTNVTDKHFPEAPPSDSQPGMEASSSGQPPPTTRLLFTSSPFWDRVLLTVLNRQLLSVVALQRRCPPRHLRNAFSSVLRIGRPLSDVLSPHSPYVP